MNGVVDHDHVKESETVNKSDQESDQESIAGQERLSVDVVQGHQIIKRGQGHRNEKGHVVATGQSQRTLI